MDIHDTAVKALPGCQWEDTGEDSKAPRPMTFKSVWNHSLRKVLINAFPLARREASAEQSERNSAAFFLILVVNFNEEWTLTGSESHLFVIITLARVMEAVDSCGKTSVLGAGHREGDR